MGFGASIFLIAVGAIFAFAVNVQTQGLDLAVVGVILMLVGLAGLLLSFTLWSDYLPWQRRRTIVRERRHGDGVSRPVAGRNREIVEYEERDV